MYIGSAINYRSRWGNHKKYLNKNCHPNKHLQAAWNECPNNFEFVILELVEDKINLLEREKYYIDIHQVCDNKYGYNKRSIPNSNLGLKWNEETKKKMSLAGKGHKRSLGKKKSEEEKQKASVRMKGKVWTQEQINRRSAHWRRKPRTKEVKEKLSRKLKGNKSALGHKVPESVKESMRKRDKWPHGIICICNNCKEIKRKIRHDRHIREYYNANV